MSFPIKASMESSSGVRVASGMDKDDAADELVTGDSDAGDNDGDDNTGDGGGGLRDCLDAVFKRADAATGGTRRFGKRDGLFLRTCSRRGIGITAPSSSLESSPRASL